LARDCHIALGPPAVHSERLRASLRFLLREIVFQALYPKGKGGDADSLRQFTQGRVRFVPQLVKPLAQRSFDHMSAKEAYGSVVCFVESDKPLLMAKSGIFLTFSGVIDFGTIGRPPPDRPGYRPLAAWAAQLVLSIIQTCAGTVSSVQLRFNAGSFRTESVA
jgi:hypothetical protein